MTEAECSRAGCRDAALWRLEWRNPKIHTADRRKTWVACGEHREFLRDYLATRELLIAVSPLASSAVENDERTVTGESA